MEQYDVIIVGGGPVGGFIAEKLASIKLNVAIFEEHLSPGTPLKCAGLVSSRVFDFVSNTQNEIIQNKVFGAYIHAPSGESLKIGGEKPRAYVIDRKRLDQLLIKQAASKGAHIHFNYRFKVGRKKKNKILCSFETKEQHKENIGALLIGADGPHSQVRSTFNFPEPQEFLQGIGAQVSGISIDPKFVYIFIGEKIAPGFFAWVIPINTNGTIARIGLCRTRQAKTTLKKCFASLLQQPLLDGSIIEERIGGTIPLGPLKITTQNQVMLVGDAAAHVKPTSGGGLYPGLYCANICADVVKKTFEKHDFSEQRLNQYHQQWKEKIGRELSMGMRFRSVFTRLSDKEFDKIIQKLNSQKIRAAIARYGDIDYPSKLALPVLSKAPSLLKLVPRMFR